MAQDKREDVQEYIGVTGIKVRTVGTPSPESCQNFINIMRELKAKYDDK